MFDKLLSIANARPLYRSLWFLLVMIVVMNLGATAFYRYTHGAGILDTAGDTVFPSSLALFLAIAITYFYSRLFSSRQVLRWLLLLPAIYLAADYLENVSIVTMLLSFPTSLSTLAVIANTMFMIKNLSSAVAVMTTVIGLSAWLFQRTRKLSAA